MLNVELNQGTDDDLKRQAVRALFALNVNPKIGMWNLFRSR